MDVRVPSIFSCNAALSNGPRILCDKVATMVWIVVEVGLLCHISWYCTFQGQRDFYVIAAAAAGREGSDVIDAVGMQLGKVGRFRWWVDCMNSSLETEGRVLWTLML